MTSTTVGLPDRYRPLEQIGPEEATPTGVITSWRAKDRVLNRDVAIRVHAPGGEAAHSWIARALTAGGLATPALAMVYDASEGTAGADGGIAYVVNEWIDGESLRDRLARGPLPDREARTVLRRLAEGVAEAHRVGLAVGGLTPDNVVLRPNGLVGLRGVPASTGSIAGDITALGALLEFALTGRTGGDPSAPNPQRAPLSPDLAALVRRARSTEPGQGLSSAAAMVALLSERPRPGGIPRPSEALRTADSGRARRPRGAEDDHARDSRSDGAAPERSGPARADDDGRHAATTPPAAIRPPVPVAPARPPVPEPTPAAGEYEPADDGPGTYGDGFGALDDDDFADEPAEGATTRRKLIVYGVPVLALAVVIGLAVWLGTSVLSVASSVGEVKGSTPTVPGVTSSSGPASTSSSGSSSAAPQVGADVPITGASVFDPFGDGEPENSNDVPKSYDGDPATSWSTLQYRGSAAFGNLKPGVGVLYDLGSAQPLAGVTLTTTLAGATVDVRTGDSPDGSLDSYAVAANLQLTGTDHVHFTKAVTARYVLIWVTQLVPADGNFQADIAEISVQKAG
jgi:tRNA A-37 threonylcarbamoyl transferase component Bud32